MKIQHKLPDVWRTHIQDCLRNANRIEQEAEILDGRAAKMRKEVEQIRNHVRFLLPPIIAEANLPESVTPYHLSDDATAIVGEIAAPVERE